jgi:hypothetical protein
MFQEIGFSSEVHLLATRRTPVFLFTHPEICEDWLAANIKFPLTSNNPERNRAAQEILRVENRFII